MSLAVFITILICLGLVMILLLLLPKLIKFKRNKLESYVNESILTVSKTFGHLISISAPIRTGKTSFASALANSLTIVLMQKLQTIINDFKVAFKRIDFNYFDNYLVFHIQEYLESKNKIDLKVIANRLILRFNLDSKAHFYDFITDYLVEDKVYEYVEAYYVLNVRNNYVVSNIPIYSRVTNNYSYELNSEWLEIHNANKNQNYSLEPYMIIIYDEVTDNKGAMAYLDDRNDESGHKEFLRKFGQYFKETSYYITTKQDVLDEIKRLRKLVQTNIELVTKVRPVGTFNNIYALVEKSTQFKLVLYKLKKRFKFFFKVVLSPKIFRLRQHKEAFNQTSYNKVNRERNVFNRLFFWKKMFFSLGYVLYELRIHQDSDKQEKDSEVMQLVFPLLYAFGTYNTHLANKDHNYLSKHSKSELKESNPYDQESRFEKKAR